MTETLTLRLTIADPVAGLHYSLQDAKSLPVDIRIATDAPLSFDVPVTLRPDGRLGGPFVRREGPVRRFIYLAIAGQAGQTDAIGRHISRRAKIDVHEIAADLLRPGAVIEATLPGRGKDGLPACATVRPLDPWQTVG
ncbi:DUF5990 family protein [Brevundimonas subvibrioides]|uniref:Uncharacterized protein n=1 Tax=Brevundimonas subvibrioides (strain ATCC 15264 / DSM 4735 / LMG 14903 / NBRC 16000 / CB 81) TaxID=633149 RepID=D9QGU4_BRESC|nr:DUF5990 family protein [Brevundimonas subvibrioides]ADL00910.1 conserved hypothetical protein [Brevundimonas subvibrioides ATCC 15264]